ncbi:DedA family protein [Streptomyces sp. NPDC051362]|uniref:DedA family protein n=1 Tax=Streptomyces sp. NPDC051362 TaxID=3365651 RepID=UPI00378E1DD7
MYISGVLEAAGWWAYVVVFVLTASETSAFVGLLVPGEATVLLASAIAGRGHLNPFVLGIVVVIGAVTGDNAGYALGRWCAGHPSRHRLPRVLSGHYSGRTRDFLTHHGGAAIFTAKFIGFARTFAPYLAGTAGMPYRRFLLHSAAASLVWGSGTVLLGYFAGAAAAGLLQSAGLIGGVVFVAITAVILAVKILPRSSRQGRITSHVVASGGPRESSTYDAARQFTRQES